MIYRFIDEHCDQWPVRLLCDAPDVAPASCYAWRDRPASARQQRRDALRVEIRAIHAEFKARYGGPRVHPELAARGQDCCVNTVARVMRENGIACSMSRRADCWDNAPMESFFASLKKELVHGADFATRAEARAAIFEYIEVFDNGQRRHSSLGYVSPAEYEQPE